MKKLKKFLRPIGIAVAVIGVMLALGFVERTADRTPISGLQVIVDGVKGIHFIDEQAVRREVLDQGIAVMGSPTAEVDVTRIEQRLRSIPCVANAEVYHTMDGTLHVKVKQREPIVRVFNSDGGSFYIDREGWTMPTNDNYTARVLVVTGQLNEPGAEEGVHSVLANDSLRAYFRSDDIHRIASFIVGDPFWNALIDQVVVNTDGEYELIPRVGAQRVLIGDGTALDQRFEKLRIFYDKGIPKADWRRYARIDLRFADQIVCTKRTTP
ncbi:MAG: FtsQ-type POTRA domain-containing protein [Flavobacteriales bacterium]|nr:FtsQ-type POTRA domain-containing protein [Flavobacteriales bacterium]HRH69484.1 FtsQ-type POTRA domain-containing protein [Flavobacteriales bacterium]